MTLVLRAVAATDQGLVRSNNEDALFVGSRLLVVADGMGGLPAGELASEILIGALSGVDEMPDTGNLGIWLTVNGESRQKSTTANLMVDVPGLVSYVSQFMTLVPGDVLSTGTPPGVGLGMKPEPVYLKPGDEVVAGIDGLGEQRQRVVVYRA